MSSGVALSKKQAGLVRAIVSTKVPVRFRTDDGEEVVVPIRAKVYLKRLVQKLYPVLLQGGVRLTGSCASQVALGRRPRRVGDIDISILVTDEVDFNQVFFHEQQILKELAAETHPAKPLTTVLLDTVRVSNETDCWTLFSFGSVGQQGRHLDIRVSQKMSRSYVFSCDSLEVVIDPILVKGMARYPMQAFSRWGDYSQALEDLRQKRLVMPAPECVRHGLIRYSLAICRGFRVVDEAVKAEIEKKLVNNFLMNFKSAEHTRTLLERTSDRHNAESALRQTVKEVISRNIEELL